MRLRTGLQVNLNLLGENIREVQRLCPKNKIIFMVKAEGYGHGMIPMVRFAAAELGIKEFGCATLGEARLLREKLTDLEFEAYVFSDIQLEDKECRRHYLNERIVPVISNLNDLNIFLADGEFRHFPLFLKFNTGMNRLGIASDDIAKVVEALKKSGRKMVQHLCSHFACASASVENDPRSKNQYEQFKKIKKYFLDSGIAVLATSMANSGAIEQGFALEETHVRPGLMLYGPSSMEATVRSKSRWKGKNISKLSTYALNVFKVKKGDQVGYGGFPCPHDGVIVLIALGYGDGFFNHYSGAEFTWKGHRGKVVGRISMDMTQLLFPLEAWGDIGQGDALELWGHDPSGILNFSDQIKTIPYEIFCGLGSRVPRIYRLD